MKRQGYSKDEVDALQPPSGGCVLKLPFFFLLYKSRLPAAFRRLCVETTYTAGMSGSGGPAAFRRLCVETSTQ